MSYVCNMKYRESLQGKRIRLESEYKKTFKVGSLYTTLFKSKLVVKCTSLNGVRSVCFTGRVVKGGDKNNPIGTVNDGWIYESFKKI